MASKRCVVCAWYVFSGVWMLHARRTRLAVLYSMMALFHACWPWTFWAQSGCGDVCCRGPDACSEFSAGVGTISARSIRCDGDFACTSVQTLNVTHGTSECTGDDACARSNMVFGGPESCLNCIGKQVCADVDVQVKAGTCLQIFCSGEDACTGLSVTLEQDSNCWYTKTTDAAAPQGCQEAGEGEGCALVQEAAPKRHAVFGFQK